MKGILRFLGRFVHGEGVVPDGAEVLVVEDGDDAFVFFERGDDLVEKPAPGVKVLALVVVGVVAVFADAEDAVDGQGVGADTEGAFDGVEDGDVELLGQFAAEVAGFRAGRSRERPGEAWGLVRRRPSSLSGGGRPGHRRGCRAGGR